MSDAGLIIHDKTGFVDQFMLDPLCESVIKGLKVGRQPSFTKLGGLTSIELNGSILKRYGVATLKPEQPMMRLRDILAEKRLTPKSLSEQMGKHDQWVSRVMRGNPTLSSLIEICIALDISIVHLMKVVFTSD